jgi:hypothetical protein
MKTIGLALMIALTAASATAQPGPLTTAMSCGQAIALVARHGAVVLSTGRWTYVRAVRNRSFCMPTEVTRPIWVPTRDTPSCLVGGECVEPEPWWDF